MPAHLERQYAGEEEEHYGHKHRDDLTPGTDHSAALGYNLKRENKSSIRYKYKLLCIYADVFMDGDLFYR